MVIIDTSVLIDHLRSSSNRNTVLMDFAARNPKEALCVSVISIQELYEGKSTVNKEKEKDMLATVAPLKVLSYTYDTAELAGRISRDLGRPLEFADAAIAATAVTYNARILTLNKKDFSGILDLELI